jgi:biotin carboxyl carrier protein
VKYYVTVNGRDHEVELVERLGELLVTVDGEPLDVRYEEVDQLGQVALFARERTFGMSIEGDGNAITATIAGHLYEVFIEDERERAAHAAERGSAARGGVVKSVMPGVVVELLVAAGDAVTAGQPLLILEAMKMQNEIAAGIDGVVSALHVARGQAVEGGAALATITPAGE